MEQIRKDSSRATPIDIAFVIDTTSSMTDDIDDVKKNLKLISDELQSMQKDLYSIRVAVVLYRDAGDEYVTKIELEFDSSISTFLLSDKTPQIMCFSNSASLYSKSQLCPETSLSMYFSILNPIIFIYFVFKYL